VATGGPLARRRILVSGTTALGLSGFVRNDATGLLVEVEGEPERIAALCRLIAEEPPPLARVHKMETAALAPLAEQGFRIERSDDRGEPATPVSPDVATCDACLAEVDDPSDRRHGYPFTNCTDCGPRYTIVLAVPYDRPATTMAGFRMCAACEAEYHDPANRRFHAQPNACPRCGPTLAFRSPDGTQKAEGQAALDAAVAALLEGQVLAVKGIGGYHLAVDATSEEAVATLRRRKARDEKPFALMVPDLEWARRLCVLDATAEQALCSRRRPILLAPRRPRARVASGVAPGLPELGLMLPYSPLHHLLLRRVARPLVMTSGNRSDEPIAHEDEDAIARLGPLVDGLVTHDRPIHVRCDDSVARAAGGRVQLLRRSRGYAPEPLLLPWRLSRQVLAVGAELKASVAVGKADRVVASHHLGDLEHAANHPAFLEAVEHLCRLFGVAPDVVGHDLHPQYRSSAFAADLDLPLHPVQHHHAHVASCLAEHGEEGPVLGVAFDGLGLGPDGTLWGGEFLVADLLGFERVGHLLEAPLPGGAAAIREPWRMAVAWALLSAGEAGLEAVGPELDERAAQVARLVERAWRAPGGATTLRACPTTTSVGRLFDAVAALVGLRRTVSYEAQAAIELEALARRVPRSEVPVVELEVHHGPDGAVLDPRPLVRAVLEARRSGEDPALVAALFHESLGRATAALAADLAASRGLEVVALSGGVFQNARLSTIAESELGRRGLRVLVHGEVPPNDGGISIGQAVVAGLAP
jgi:hydrogenase maturation protein HypF